MLTSAITAFLTDTDVTQNPDLNISKDYYELCWELASHTNDSGLKHRLCDAIFQTLRVTNQSETSKYTNRPLDCILYLLQILLSLVKQCEVKDEYIEIMFEDCLFGRQLALSKWNAASQSADRKNLASSSSSSSSSSCGLPNQFLCGEESLRGKAFELLSALLTTKDKKTTECFLHKVSEHLDIHPHVQEKWEDLSRCQRRRHFVGLENLGSTCYLNCIIQTLFMIPSFSNRILQFPYAIKKVPLLCQMQKLFLMLSKSQRQMLNPKPFIDTVRTPT
ncbi:hypothetical protein RFI_03857, partial [Reticulomyxa filosa]